MRVSEGSRVELREGKGGYYLVIVGGNGEPMFTSEGYASRSNALRAARTNLPGCTPYDAKTGEPIHGGDA